MLLMQYNFSNYFKAELKFLNQSISFLLLCKLNQKYGHKRLLVHCSSLLLFEVDVK